MPMSTLDLPSLVVEVDVDDQDHDDEAQAHDHHHDNSDAIIDVLAHLHPQHTESVEIHDDLGSQDGLVDTSIGGLGTTTTGDIDLDNLDVDALKQEVRRLRSLLRGYGYSEPNWTSTEVIPSVKGGRKRKRKQDIPTSDEAREVKKKAVPKIERDEETGKRVDKGRRLELSRALRTKMRFSMNIGPDDPLPPPTLYPDGENDEMAGFAGYGIPNWTSPSDPTNNLWIDRMAAEIIEEASSGEHTKIPREDLDPDIVKATARTSFLNFCKRYLAETDPGQASKKEKYAKGRRRWARKDLKQKRRAKAALDPSFSHTLPPAGLHLDYMSSEYSSLGEDTDKEDDEDLDEQTRSRRHEKKAQRDQRWAEMLAIKAAAQHDQEEGEVGKRGWNEGVSEKVLEVRTPRWRSSTLNDIYKRLDGIAATWATVRSGPSGSRTKSGHVAPSHKRFTMDDNPLISRRGKIPRDNGEGWMWASGQAGTWPDQGQSSSDANGHQSERGMQRDNEGQTFTGMDEINMPEIEGMEGLESIQDVQGVHDEQGWEGDETGALVSALQGIPA